MTEPLVMLERDGDGWFVRFGQRYIEFPHDRQLDALRYLRRSVDDEIAEKLADIARELNDLQGGD